MDPSGRAYEDFVPPHTMVREPATHTLSVDLSAAGYKKEHIRVQMVHSHRRLVVRGERPIAGNRWSRFRLEFNVPDGCDTKGIHARFDNGVVRVTMPGLAPEPVAVDAAAGQQEPSPPAKTATAAASGVQDKKDGDRAKDGGRDNAGDGGEVVAASPSGGGYGFLHDRRKLRTTLLGVVLVLISLGIYVRYSLWP